MYCLRNEPQAMPLALFCFQTKHIACKINNIRVLRALDGSLRQYSIFQDGRR